MSEQDSLLELLDYDLWANVAWIEPASHAGLTLVLAHILHAQQTWLERCRGNSAHIPEITNPATENFAETTTLWKELLAEIPLSTSLTYTTRSGDNHTNDLHAILRHVLNHGTYHRGDMRGRCELLGKPFPETDLIGYFWRRGESR